MEKMYAQIIKSLIDSEKKDYKITLDYELNDIKLD